MTAGACGGTSEDDLFPQISDPGQTITVEMLQATPFKQSKEYALEGLPGATYVGYGFLRVGGGDPYGYEVRFYESHEIAKTTGFENASTAIDQSFREGGKYGSSNRGAGSHAVTKYKAFAVVGNTVMLCEQSVDSCIALADVLGN